MYLPTFWKLQQEVYMFKMAKVAGWGLPAAAMSKSSTPKLFTDTCQDVLRSAFAAWARLATVLGLFELTRRRLLTIAVTFVR